MIQFLKVGQVAKILQVSPTKVYRWLEDGQLEGINVGEPNRRPQWRIHPDALSKLCPAGATVASPEDRVVMVPLHDIDIF